jgi:hypothetical protein
MDDPASSPAQPASGSLTSAGRKGRFSWSIACLLLAVVAWACFSVKNARWDGFWYDESVQYWISQGVDAFAPPLQTPGTLVDVMKHNAIANLDPGGFSVMLHYWLKVSCGPEWQRVLPLIVFAFGLAGMGWLGWRWGRSLLFAVFSAMVPAAFTILTEFAFEVRAYSMEFTGVVCACLVLDLLLEKPKAARCLMGGLLVGLFLWSRYSFGLVAAIMGLVFAWCMLRQKGDASSRLMAVVFLAIPMIAVGAAMIYWGFLPQYRDRITYNDGELMRYLEPLQATGAASRPVYVSLLRNLFLPAAWPITIGSLLALVFFTRWMHGERAAAFRERSAPFYLVALGTVALTAALWKWHPWDMGTKWSSYLHALSAVLVVRLAADVLMLLKGRSANTSAVLQRTNAIMIVLICILSIQAVRYERTRGFGILPALKYLDRTTLKPGQVGVETGLYPTLKYYYEGGPFTGRAYYPDSFRLVQANGPRPVMSKRARYLIAPYLAPDLKKVFPDVEFSTDRKLPALLHRVQPPTPKAPAPVNSGKP